GPENIYPKKIGSYTVGDAHWATLTSSRIYDNINLKHDLNSIVESVNGSSVALLGGRFISWVIAKELDKQVDEIIISDVDPRIQNVTVDNLQEELDATIIKGDGDVNSSEKSDDTIITSTIPNISNKILNKVPDAINLV
ncbi:MAG: FeGP cofactor biosynthesis family protein, partial [Methanobrevibacter sp.]